MIDTAVEIIKDVGFPIFVAIVLLYDRIKTNGNLLKVVEGNTAILKRIEGKL